MRFFKFTVVLGCLEGSVLLFFFWFWEKWKRFKRGRSSEVWMRGLNIVRIFSSFIGWNVRRLRVIFGFGSVCLRGIMKIVTWRIG